MRSPIVQSNWPDDEMDRSLAAKNRTFRRYDRETAWVEVSLTSLASNLGTLCTAAGGTQALAVVKANAYGLGVREIARALETCDVWGFAVATLDEGIELRRTGIRKPILVLRPAHSGNLIYYKHYQLRPVVESIRDDGELGLPFHVEIDTGMGRTGIRWDDEAALRRVALAAPEAAFTHFHSADISGESVQLQWKRFEQALRCMGNRPRLLHAANSAASWGLTAKLDLIRPGIFLYGGSPGPDFPTPVPVVSVRARIISIRDIRQGESVGYGATWYATSHTRVATLPVGYADGIPHMLQPGAYVLVAGRRHRIIGKVTMDMTMIDIGPRGSSGVELGDTATLIGVDRSDEITLEQFSEWSRTINYEVLTRLGARLPRVYVNAGNSSV